MSIQEAVGAGAKRAWRLRDFADAHGIGVTKVYKEISSGRLKAHKLGSATLIFDEDGRAWRDSLSAVKAVEEA